MTFVRTRGLLSAAFALCMVLGAARAQAQDVAISDEARAHFKAGVNLLQDPDGARYEEAYREFRAAYAISPSWKILGNLGIAALKLERDGEALDAFTRYLAEGKDQVAPEERAQFERDIQTLQSGVVRLTLDSNPPGARILDERIPATGNVVQNAYGPLTQATTLGIRSGRHRITARLEGYPDQVWEVDAEPRQQLSHTFVFQSAAPATTATPTGSAQADTSITPGVPAGTNGMRIGAYAAFGVGVAGVAAGTFFALRSKSKYDDANDICPNFPCNITQAQADRREELGDDGDSAKTLSLVGFIVGGAGIAAGTTLFILSGNKERPPSQAGVQPWIGPASLGLTGQF